MATQPLSIILWTGGNAPTRDAKLTVGTNPLGFYALWEPGYCGCEDCSPIVGYGATEAEAIADYQEKWEDAR